MSKYAVTIDDETFQVELDPKKTYGTELIVTVDGAPVRVRVPDRDAPAEQMEWFVIEDTPYEIVYDPDFQWIRSHSRNHQIEVRDLEKGAALAKRRDGRVKAPIPGLVTQVLVKEGDPVELGQTLLVLEAMKMENEIHAPRSGQIVALHAAPGQTVLLNELLVEVGD